MSHDIQPSNLSSALLNPNNFFFRVGKLIVTKAIGYMSDELETDYENITETYKVECPMLWQITIKGTIYIC